MSGALAGVPQQPAGGDALSRAIADAAVEGAQRVLQAGGEGAPWFWLIVGFAGQALFTSRFLVQWWASERAGRSVVPVAFWWFSITGAATLLAYAIYRVDPVFILGQCTGMFIYTRNLALIRRERERSAAADH